MERIEWPNEFPDEDKMIDMIKKTISTSWKNDLAIDDINLWLDNFKGDIYTKEDEQRLALWMLVYYTFYNENEVNHLCRTLYKNFLHDVAVKEKADSDELLADVLDNTYFASLGKAGESGGLMLYYFRQEAGISIDRFFYPTSIHPDNSKIVVFIDDVTLSGSTAIRFFKNNMQCRDFKHIYYITLFASNTAVENLEKSGITVLYANLLSDRDKSFSDKSLMFFHFPSLKEPAKKVAEHYGKMICPDYPLGYKDGQYCFGFSYNTPNNTLPIFWSNNQWHPLFQRKEKIYNVRGRENKFGQYI